MPGRWTAVPLLLLLPFVWGTGRALVRLSTRDARLARLLAPGVGLVTWLLAIHASGLVTHSFYVALYVGTAAAAALGAWSLRRELPAETSAERTRWWMWLGAAMAVALLVGPVLWSKHDECLLIGHVSIPTEMQNGVYPPRHLTFPGYELKYHYGADLAAATVSSVLGRLDVHLTVHLLALALFGYTFCLLWLLGERLIGGWAAGPVTATCVLFAGGAPYFCKSPSAGTDYWTSMCTRGGTWITPPMPSNFLQHPWSLGLPIFAMILLVWIRVGPGLPSRWGWVLLGLLTAMLSLAQTTLFICIVPCLVAVGSLQERRPSAKRLARYAAWAVAMMIAARLMHGFLAPAAEPAQSRIGLHPFWGETTPREFLLWHLEGFGALLPLGMAGFFFLRSQRVLLGLLAGGGLLVRDLFKYWPSWNIVKFSMVTQIVLAILAAAVLSAAFSRRRWWPLGLVGLVACTFFGFAWTGALSRKLPTVSCIPHSASAADLAAITFLRQRIAAGEAVFRSEHGDSYAILGGLPQPSYDWGVQAFGFSDSLFAERQRLMAHPDDLDALRRQGFRWMVLAPRDAQALAAARRWTDEGRAELAAEFPPLAVYRLR